MEDAPTTAPVGDRAITDPRLGYLRWTRTTQENPMASNPTRPLALVTGASSGIGLELARQFADNGFDLVIAAEDEELASAVTELEGSGTEVAAFRLDLSTAEGVEELYDQVREMGRPLDAAALNAGIGA